MNQIARIVHNLRAELAIVPQFAIPIIQRKHFNSFNKGNEELINNLFSHSLRNVFQFNHFSYYQSKMG